MLVRYDLVCYMQSVQPGVGAMTDSSWVMCWVVGRYNFSYVNGYDIMDVCYDSSYTSVVCRDRLLSMLRVIEEYVL